MSYRPHGRYVNVDENSPYALGICDKSGFVFRRIDMVKQMEWRGNALIWTGFIVGKPFVDTPNAQLKPPILPPDPVPVQNPRLQQPTTVIWSNQSIPWSLSPVVNWVSWYGSEDGVPAATEPQRLAALEEEIQPPQSYGNSGYFPPPAFLTQQQILASLQSTAWNTPL